MLFLFGVIWTSKKPLFFLKLISIKETFETIWHWFNFYHFRGNIFSNIQKIFASVRSAVKTVRSWIIVNAKTALPEMCHLNFWNKKMSVLTSIISFRSSNLFITELMFIWPIITIKKIGFPWFMQGRIWKTIKLSIEIVRRWYWI